MSYHTQEPRIERAYFFYYLWVEGVRVELGHVCATRFMCGGQRQLFWSQFSGLWAIQPASYLPSHLTGLDLVNFKAN